jgi:hypothetical protein
MTNLKTWVISKAYYDGTRREFYHALDDYIKRQK